MSVHRSRGCGVRVCVLLCAALYGCDSDSRTPSFALRDRPAPVPATTSRAGTPPIETPRATASPSAPRAPGAAPAPSPPAIPLPAPIPPDVVPPPNPPPPPFVPGEASEVVSIDDTPITERDLGTLDPGGPLPDCRTAVETDAARPPATRWLAVRAGGQSGALRTQLIEVGDEGPGPAHEIAPEPQPYDIGRWSHDGRFFATWTRDDNAGEMSYIADLETGAPAVSKFPGRFAGFAPHSGHFLTFSGMPVIRDLTERELFERTVQLPLGASESLVDAQWSADGRYVSILTSIDSLEPQRLYLVDTRDDAPRADVAFSVGSVRSHAWAPRGARLAYLSWFEAEQDLALLVVQPGRTETPVRIEGMQRELSRISWIDADRMLIHDAMGNPGVADVSGDAPVRTMIDALDASEPRLLGDSCMAYRGGCGPSTLLGTCVASLEPDQPLEPRRVYPGDNEYLAMPTHGSPLVFNDPYDHRIIEVALEGGDFQPRRLTDRGYRDERAIHQVFVASGPDPSWVYYTAPSDRFSPGETLHFWNRRSQRTYEFDPQSRYVDSAGMWSPDGVLLATHARSPDFIEEGSLLVLTRFDAQKPLQQHAVELYIPQVSFDPWLVWQP